MYFVLTNNGCHCIIFNSLRMNILNYTGSDMATDSITMRESKLLFSHTFCKSVTAN